VPQIVLLVGPNSCGKGTQATLLQKAGFEIFSVSDSLRAEYHEYIARGEPVPDRIVNSFVGLKLQQALRAGTKLVVDGFPRTTGQAEFLLNCYEDSVFRERVVLVHLLLPLVEAWRRAKQRREEALKLGLEVRVDDRPEIVKKRLRQYSQEVYPAAAFFERHLPGHCFCLSALPSIPKVFERISERLQLSQVA